MVLTYFVSNFFARALSAASSSVQKGSEGSKEGPFITSPRLFFPIRSCCRKENIINEGNKLDIAFKDRCDADNRKRHHKDRKKSTIKHRSKMKI